MPYYKSLPFNTVNEISIQCGNNAAEIFVNNNSLGCIGSNYPATVFISENSSGQLFITLKQISNQEYIAGNNNDPLHTVYFSQNANNSKLDIKKCNTADNYKIIGWEDVDILQMCNNGVTKYFAINAESEFKAKIEIVNNVSVMVIRYGLDVVQQAGNNPLCITDLHAYACAP